jgi:glucokinase
VAGPVETVAGRLFVKTTNLPWTLDQAVLAKTIGVAVEAVGIINDLAANAVGIDAIAPDKVLVLQKGEDRTGNRAIISAGTGLGEAGLMWDVAKQIHRPVPSEGGHSSFGPRNELEDDLLRYLRGQEREKFNGHVSCERVLSGPGLSRLFDFLRHRGVGDEKVQIPPGIGPGEAAKYITQAGMDGSCPRCVATVDLFVGLYGAAAGNLALQFLSLGGLYVGGGIAPRLAEKLKGPAFMEAFLEKGPLKGRVLEKIPVRVILDPHTALRGAGRYADKLM